MTRRHLVTAVVVLFGHEAARADTVVLTPHVQENVVPEARQLARRIGDALRQHAAPAVRITETRTLPTLGESLLCDVQTVACLQLVARTLRADELISGDLMWNLRSLTLQLFRSDRAGAQRIAEAIVPELLDDSFDAWIQHLVRRLHGRREGIVVLKAIGPLSPDARVKIAGELAAFNAPVFLAVGHYSLSLEVYGERQSAGTVDVTDGRVVEKRIEAFHSPSPARSAGCCPQQRRTDQLPIAFGVLVALRRRRRRRRP
jgi:hypothetical protein